MKWPDIICIELTRAKETHIVTNFISENKRPTLLMNLSCSSACLAILSACFESICFVWTACLDNISFIRAKPKSHPKHKNQYQIQKQVKIKSKSRSKHTLDLSLNLRLTSAGDSSFAFSTYSSLSDISAVNYSTRFLGTQTTQREEKKTTKDGEGLMLEIVRTKKSATRRSFFLLPRIIGSYYLPSWSNHIHMLLIVIVIITLFLFLIIILSITLINV